MSALDQIKSFVQPVLLRSVPGLESELEREAVYRAKRLVKLNQPELWLAEVDDWVWCAEKIKIAGTFEIVSIQKASEFLKSIDRFWAHLPFESVRRGELIAEATPAPRFAKTLTITPLAPRKSFRYFGLFDRDHGFYSEPTEQSALAGNYLFQEDKNEPPSRAYLKLWEAFLRSGFVPESQSTVVDLGSCPGGWTWVLAKFADKTYSVDGASIVESVAKMPGVEFIKRDAFTLKPLWDDSITLFCSDMICDPEKLFQLVQEWMVKKPNLRFICTLKFKGQSSFDAITKFQDLDHSVVVHLHHNKHELTWIRLPEGLPTSIRP